MDIDLFHGFLGYTTAVCTKGQGRPLKEEEWIRELWQVWFESQSLPVTMTGCYIKLTGHCLPVGPVNINISAHQIYKLLFVNFVVYSHWGALEKIPSRPIRDEQKRGNSWSFHFDKTPNQCLAMLTCTHLLLSRVILQKTISELLLWIDTGDITKHNSNSLHL